MLKERYLTIKRKNIEDYANYKKFVKADFSGDYDAASEYLRGYAVSEMNDKEKSVGSAWQQVYQLNHRIEEMVEQGDQASMASLKLLVEQRDNWVAEAEKLTKEHKRRPNQRF